MRSISKVRSWWLEREVAPDVAPVVDTIVEGEGPLKAAVAIGPRVLRPLVETIGVLGEEPDLDRRVWAICKRFDADVATGELLAFLADRSFGSRAWRSFKAGGFD